MRQIDLKQFEFERQGITDAATGQPAKETFDYADYLRTIILNAPQKQGLSYADLKHCAALDRALAGANGHLLLEEDTFEFVSRRIKDVTWVKYTPYSMQFVDDVTGAPQVEVQPKDEPAA